MLLKKLSKDTLIYGINVGIKSLIPVLMLPVLTTYLSPEEYGILSIIEISILFLMPFITLNCHGAIKVAFFKLDYNKLKYYISDAISISLILFVFVLLLSILFSAVLSQSMDLPECIILLLPFFALLRLSGEIVGVVFQVKHKPISFSVFTTFQTLLDVSLSLSFVIFYQLGYIGRLAGIYSSYLMATIAGIYLLYRMKLLSFKPSFKFVKDIISFGVPLIPHAIGGAILAMSDRYFISYFIGHEEVGYYTVAYQLSALILLVSTSVNLAWSPIFFKLLKDESAESYKQILKTLSIIVFVFLSIGVVIYMLEDVLFYVFSDISFEIAKEYFPYLLIGFVFQSIYIIFSNLFFYERKTLFLSKITLTIAGLNIVLNYFFIREFSTIGVAYATSISWFIFSFIIVAVVLNKLRLKNEVYSS